MAEYKSNYTGQQIDTGIGKANTAVQPADLSSYQEKLVSGENIKTINGTSILGEGNMVIESGTGGLSSVAHDNTMTGAGTNESPLGVDTTKIAQKSDIPDISGKQDKIDSSHKLSADLISDGETNKTVTETEKTTWNGKSVVSGTNDGTNWSTITINGTTKSIPVGGGAGTASWGSITGTLSSQTDLQDVLDSKGTYSKPSGGIPKTDLADAVQTSLGKADTALQSETYTGTITSVKMNGNTISTSGEADLGTVITEHQSLNNYYTKTEVDSKVSSVYKYKGTVSTYSNLPSTNLTIGDVYNVETDGSNYAWTGTAWDKLGGDVDLSGYQTKIDSLNKLSADLISDGETNKTVTTTEKTTWNGKSVVSGTNDGTNWTSLTIDGTTKTIPSGGAGGTSNYSDLTNKPKLNSVTIDGAMIANVKPVATNDSQISYWGEPISIRTNLIKRRKFFDATNTGTPQSMCTYDDYLFIVCNTGIVDVYDLTEMQKVGTFTVPNSSSTIHGSNCSFGRTVVTGSSFPALYISATLNRTCYAYKITRSGNTFSAELIQTIAFDVSDWGGTGNNYIDYLCDDTGRFMYLVGYYNYQGNPNYMIVKKVELPSLTNSTVSLSATDVLDSFNIDEVKVIQGCVINDGKLYIGNNGGTMTQGVLVADLKTHDVISNIPITDIVEIEGVCTYKGTLLVQENGSKVFMYKTESYTDGYNVEVQSRSGSEDLKLENLTPDYSSGAWGAANNSYVSAGARPLVVHYLKEDYLVGAKRITWVLKDTYTGTKSSTTTGLARQLFPKVMDRLDISLPITSSDIGTNLYDDTAWQTDTCSIDLTNYPTVKTFGYTYYNSTSATNWSQNGYILIEYD